MMTSWIQKVTRSKGFPDGVVQISKAKLFTFGSFRLGVHDPGADIDAVCVGPIYANREVDFFTLLHHDLDARPEVTELNCIRDAYVPVMKFKFLGMSVDLLYARIAMPVIPDDLDLSQDSVLCDTDQQSVRSLDGPRVAEQILRLVPNEEDFRTALRAIKFWAKQQGVYSKGMGFLSGISCALLVARVCQHCPFAIPSMVVSRFFSIYSSCNWAHPIKLCPIEERELGFRVWNPWDRPNDCMPIITPAYPCSNCGYKVSTSTLRILREQFQNGTRKCEDVEMNRAQWGALFEPYPFFEAYNSYLKVDIVGADENDFADWKGWVESKLNQLPEKIELSSKGLLQCHLYPRGYNDSVTSRYHCAFFMGLRQQQGVPEHLVQPYISTIVEDFRQLVSTYRFWKPGMNINDSSISRQQIPLYVFPAGVRGPR